MSSDKPTGREVWSDVKTLIGDRTLTLGSHWSFNLRRDPKRLAFVLSRYKFAAKMAAGGSARRILELGCSEGIGVPILAEFAEHYTGVDLDAEAIETARRNWGASHRTFIAEDFGGRSYGSFDAVVSLDVVEHIEPESEDLYFDTIAANLEADGIAIVGTPNKTADVYASPMSKIGHVNLFDGQHLSGALTRLFHNVFLFGINDEVVHTGFTPMAHYLVGIGCNRRSGG